MNRVFSKIINLLSGQCGFQELDAEKPQSALLVKASWGLLCWGVFCLGFILLNASFVCWGLNKGFEIKDEAFVLLNFKWPTDYHFVSFFQYIIDKCLGGRDLSVIGYRVLGVWLRVVSVLVFVVGFRAWLISALRESARWFLQPLFLTGLLLLADWFVFTRYEMTLSYHTMNAASLYASAGLILLFLARVRKQHEAFPPSVYLLLVLAGMLTGLDLFIKLSSSVAFLMMSSVLLLLAGGDHQRSSKRSWAIGAFMVGYVLGLGVFFSAILDVNAWWQQLSDSVHYEASTQHKPLQILNKYLMDYWKLLRVTATVYLPVLLLTVGSFLGLRKFQAKFTSKTVQAFRIALTVLVLCLIAWQCWGKGPFGGILEFFWLVTLLAFIVKLTEPRSADTLAETESSKLATQKSQPVLYFWGVALYLGLLNFVGILGSATGIASSFSSYMLPPVALLVMISARFSSRQMQIVFLGFLLVALQITWLRYFVYEGQRYLDSNISQTQMVQGVPALSGLQLDPPRARFFQDLYHIVNRSRQSAAPPVVLGLLEMPGLVYALDGYPVEAPYTAWMTFRKQRTETYCHLLDSIRQQRPANPDWYVLVQEEMPPLTEPCTQRFLTGFHPLQRLWNPNNQQWLTIYKKTSSAANKTTASP